METADDHNDLNNNTKNIIYLKVRHDHDVTALKIEVANCSDIV